MDQGYRELLFEIQRLENELQAYQSISMEDINKLVTLAGKMRNLLMKCRNEQINYSLAKEIDYVLREAQELD